MMSFANRIRPKENVVWTVCGNCDAAAWPHTLTKCCSGGGCFVLGRDPHEAPHVDCEGGDKCQHEAAIMWCSPLTGDYRIKNTSQKDLVVEAKCVDRRFRALLCPGETTRAIEGLPPLPGHEIEFTWSEDTSSMRGTVKLTTVGDAKCGVVFSTRDGSATCDREEGHPPDGHWRAGLGS